MKNLLQCVLVMLVCAACNSSPHKEVPSEEWTAVDLDYAERFRIFKNEHGFKVEILPVDSTQVSETLVFGSAQNADVPNIPTKGVVLSTAHFGHLELLNQMHSIVGVESMDYVFTEEVRSRFDNGDIVELGKSGNLSIERLIALQPDYISLSGGGATSRELEKLASGGIPVLQVLGWKESHPLGRAEWIKFFGCLYNQLPLADSIYQDVKKKYLATKAKANANGVAAEYLFGYNYKGTWFLPGGNSYLSALVQDAGGVYKYADDEHLGSLQFSMEIIMKEFLTADVWLSPGACNSKEEMLALDNAYALFDPFKNNRIYNYTKRQLPNGGNDYWESSPAMPHKVLEDLFIINQNGNDSGLYYFERIQ